MKFKIGENLPFDIAELLIENGNDAKTVVQQKMGGAPDNLLLNTCIKEDRILITLDTDFSDIRKYHPEDYPGIIVIRTTKQSKAIIVKVFKNVLEKLKNEPLSNHLWIVEESLVRIRGGGI